MGIHARFTAIPNYFEKYLGEETGSPNVYFGGLDIFSNHFIVNAG